MSMSSTFQLMVEQKTAGGNCTTDSDVGDPPCVLTDPQCCKNNTRVCSTNNSCISINPFGDPGLYKAKCSEIIRNPTDPDYSCPIFSGRFPISIEWANTVSSSCTTSRDKTLSCTYDVEIFREAGVVLAYRNQQCGGNCDGDDIYNKIIMPTFCSQTSLICPSDPFTGQTLDSCSLLNNSEGDPNSGGGLCRDWCAKNPTECDTVKNNWCAVNSSNVQCACLKPQSQKNNIKNLFSGISAVAGSGPIGCWWLPCKSLDGEYLVTNNIVNAAVNCPTVCQQIIQAINNQETNIDLTNIDQILNCSGIDPNIPPATPESQETSISSFWWFFGILLIVLVLLIIGIAIFLIFRYK